MDLAWQMAVEGQKQDERTQWEKDGIIYMSSAINLGVRVEILGLGVSLDLGSDPSSAFY